MHNISFPALLKVAVVPYKHSLEININPEGRLILSGVTGRFVDVVMKYLGFPFEVVVPPDGEWGRKVNGNWTGIIGMVKSGAADLGVGYLAITKERSQAVDFSDPYTEHDKTFVTALPKQLQKTTAFLYPFHWDIWIGCGCVLLVMSFLSKALADRNLLGNLYVLLGSLWKQPIPSSREFSKWRSIYAFWYVFVFFITTSYCAVLLSFLTNPLSEKVPQDNDELARAVEKGQYKCFSLKGTDFLDTLLNSRQEATRIIGEHIKRHKWEISMDEKEHLDKLQEGGTAVIVPRLLAYLRYDVPPFSTMYISEDKFDRTEVGIALKYNFCCKRKINRLIKRLLWSGIYRKIVADEIFFKARRYTHYDYEIPLSITDVYGIFVFLILGNLLSFFALLGEIIFYHNIFMRLKFDLKCFLL